MTTSDTVYKIYNGGNPAPYEIEVVYEPELDQYRITLKILEKRFSRIEKARMKAIDSAKHINTYLESAFLYMWEDNS